MNILITGANGFLGRNLQLRLSRCKGLNVVCFTRDNTPVDLFHLLDGVDFVFHFAGVNRPLDPDDFVTDNYDLTTKLVDSVEAQILTSGRSISILYTSSIQADLANPYGSSKRLSEDVLNDFSKRTGSKTYIYRLPNVFGKWCRPNYNSVVATFCHNISLGIPVVVNDPAASLSLVYVEDVIDSFVQLMTLGDTAVDPAGFATVTPQYTVTLAELHQQLIPSVIAVTVF